MKSRTLVCSALLALCTCSGPRIGLRVLKPAAFDLPGITSLAVLDFDMRGSWSFWYDRKEVTLLDIAKEILTQALGMETKKPRPDPRTAYPGTRVSERLTARLIENGHYSVIDNAAISAVVQKNNFSMPNYGDDAKVLQLGSLISADAIVLGAAAYEMKDDGDWVTYTEKIKKKVEVDSGVYKQIEEEVQRTVFRAVRKVTLDLTYRVISIKSGQVAATHQFRQDRTLTSEDAYPLTAFRNLPDWQPALDDMIGGITRTMVTHIAPHYVHQSRQLLKGKSKSMHKAAKLAQHGMLDEARTTWQSVADRGGSPHLKDREAALYNLGVYAEIADDLDTAESYFDQCFKLTGKNKYLQYRVRIQQRRKELIRLRQNQ